jgi:hypothetical protein
VPEDGLDALVGQEDRLHGPGHLVGAIEGRAFRQLEPHVEGALIHPGQEIAVEYQGGERGQRQRPRRHAQDHAPVVE